MTKPPVSPTPVTPMQVLVPLMADLANVVNCLYKVIKGQFLSVVDLMLALAKFKGLDMEAILLDVETLNQTDRQALQTAFDNAVSIADPNIQQKVIGTSDVIEKSIEVLIQASGVYASALVVINEAKTIFGIV